MSIEAWIGIFVLTGALGLLTFLTLWARKSIDVMGKNGYISPRKKYRENGDE